MNAPSLLRRSLATASLAALATLATPAAAHFVLETPASWMSQSSLGDPQKAPPCGDEPGGTPTGIVTAFKQGDMVTITIDETIYHPGHYRIALAVNDRSELPPEPKVTAAGNDPCAAAEITMPAKFPVLADGVFLHSAPFSGPKTIQVKLPSDVTCDKCTLQIIEFMSNHGLNNPGGCFYHHCADISISPASTTSDAGAGGSGGTGTGTGTTTNTTGTTGTGAGTTGTGTDAGTSGDGGSDGSGGDGNELTPSSSACNCSVPGGGEPALAGLVGLLGLSLLLRRRRA